jgi:hypothetical protein
VKSKNEVGEPIIRLLSGRTVLTVFTFNAGAPKAHQSWSESGSVSRKSREYLDRRKEALQGLTNAQKAVIYDRDDAGHPGWTSHVVQMVGDDRLTDLLAAGFRLRGGDIPGYREVYEFPGLTLRSEVLFAALDRLRDAGVAEVQIDTLRRVAYLAT